MTGFETPIETVPTTEATAIKVLTTKQTTTKLTTGMIE